MGSADEQGKLWGASVVDWAQYAEPHHEPYWRSMLTDMNVQKGTRVLDTGCGAGGGARIASELGAQVYGIDASPEMVSYAQASMPGGDFRVGELEEMPYDDNCFDAVMAANSVQYAHDPTNALQEIRRVCSPNGKISVCTWDVAEKNEQRLLHETISKYMPQKPKPPAGPFALAASGVLEKFVESAGLKVISGEIVPVIFSFEKLDKFVRHQFSSGANQKFIASFGADKFREVISEFYEEHQGDDGVLLIHNQFRFVTAIPV